MWRKVRITLLLLILLFVALDSYFDRLYSTDWDIPLRVAVFPINADGSAVVSRYIEDLRNEDFAGLEAFFVEEAQRYAIGMERPIRFTLNAQVRELPPKLEPKAGTFSVILWSLRSRYWAWRVPHKSGPKPDVQLFMLYHDPAQFQSLPHSVGLQKGLFGIVNAFADRELSGANDTVAAHELLHTLGASDKYRYSDNQPLHPQGYAEPDRSPLHPQSFAELMGGRIPRTAAQAETPRSLNQVVIGALTAAEIGWTQQ